MRFLSLEVRGFGNLAPGRYEFSDRTLVSAGNAAGKTTLAAALRAALYGLQADHRRQAITDLDAYLPWSGGEYGLALAIEAAGARWMIDRDFAGAAGASGVGGVGLVVKDAAGNDVTAEFLAGKGGDALGKRLLRVAPAEFDRAVLAGDGAWGGWAKGAGGLVDLLGRVVATEKGGGTAARAIAACNEALRSYQGELIGIGKVETEIKRASDRRNELQRELRALEEQHRDFMESLTELDEMRDEQGLLEARIARIRLARARAQIAETERSAAARQRAEAELAAKRARRARLEHLAGFPAERDRDVQALADKVAQGRTQAHRYEESLSDQIGPRLARLEGDLAALGPVPDGFTLSVLASRVGALVARESTLSALRQERGSLLQTIEAEGVALPEIELVHAGLDRLAETERQLLRDQERVGFEDAELDSRLVVEEKAIQAEVSGWRLDAARAGRWRNMWALAAGVGAAVAALSPLLAGGSRAERLVPLLAPVAGGAGLFLVAAILALLAQRRAGDLIRRCRLQSEDRLLKIAQAREEAARQRAWRQARLAELAPAMLGPAKAAELAPTAEALLVLYRRHDAFRNRHEAWFRTAERIADEESELAAAKAALRACLESAAGSADLPQDPAAIPAAKFEAELDRRRRIETLRAEVAHARELKESALREARRAADLVDEASGQAAGILASLPAGCRWPEQPAADPDLAAAFARQPRAVAQWFAERAEEARERTRLDAEVLPALERRLADHPPVAETERALAALRQETAQLEAEAAPPDSAADVIAEFGASPAELGAAAGELTRKRDELARAIAARGRELAEVERQRRLELPKLRCEDERLRGLLGRANDFREAVLLAREVIERLAGEVYEQWSSHLNPDAGRLIARLCPEISGIRFTPDLDYEVTLPGGRTLDSGHAERQLSSGVRDQIVLGIRLALARFLARPGDPLPLILDDPFARYDDARYRLGMEALPEEAGGHQIILMTCQQERLRWLGEAAPEALVPWSRLALR